MNVNRPRIKLKPVPGDILLDMLGWALLIIAWIISFYSYSLLPDEIPVHFDLTGNITRYGSKATLFAMPALTTVLLIGLSILNKYPHIFNYPYPITPENAEKQYRIATSLIRWLKLSVAGLFLFIEAVMINASRSETYALPNWLFLLVMLLFFVPIIVYFVAAKRSR
jgi:uncharacterized membrane protein